MERQRNVWALLAAFGLGVLVYPLYRLARGTWRELRAERSEQRVERLEDARRQRERFAAGQGTPGAGSGEGGRPPGSASNAEAGGPRGPSGAADVWTSAESDADADRR